MYRYIIVDDEAPIQMGIKKRLESLDSKLQFCGFAYNGEEALKLIHKTQPHIVITDMNMPIMSGKHLLSELTENNPEIKVIVISGYKDFEYLHVAIQSGAVDYLLKPFSKDDLIAAVNKAIMRLKDQASITTEQSEEDINYNNDLRLIRTIIYNKPTNKPILSSNKLLHLNSNNRLLMITIHSESPLPEFSIKQFLKDNEFGKYVLFLQHESNPNISFLLIFIPENSFVDYQKFSYQIASSLDEKYCNENSLIFGISQIHNNILELHNAFEETVHCMNERKASHHKNIYNDYPTSTTIYDFCWDKQSEFLFRLETGDYNNVKKLLEELFCIFQKQDFSIGEIKHYLINIYEQSRTIMKQYFSNIHTMSASHSTQMVYFTMFTFEELKEYYIQFFSNITTILQEQNIYSAKEDIVEQMKLYINKNYMNNISIELLSSLFYINRSYCSSLFKERTGQNFVDYLNSVRIKHAKKLLKNTDKKISQIATESGYSNNKYFYRIFKKFTGITPDAYRNNTAPLDIDS